ncbi:hypothetical protein Droror1_Dr00026414 [Drosera rotundifolia]
MDHEQYFGDFQEYILNMNHTVHTSAIPPAQSHRAMEQSNETTDPAPTGWKKFKKDLKNPLVAAILIFFSGVLVLGIISALIKDHLPDKSKRVPWSDNVNQVINVLFTLLNLYQHPARFQHLVFWYRWRPRDVEMLRIVYCKNGTEKRNERPHILVVILLAQAGCFSQYGIAYFNWAYPMPDRPQKSIKAFIGMAVFFGTAMGIYMSCGPLGMGMPSEGRDEEAPAGPDDRIYSLVPRNGEPLAPGGPQWAGGLFDLTDDCSGACLSTCCLCCIFGWNAERLGFYGDMYCQAITFLLFCISPLVLFNVAAIHLVGHTVKVGYCVLGVLASLMGLMYGGGWRIGMRRRFHLPGDDRCCGKAAITDCLLWQFCCVCALSQEVRTASSYTIVEKDKRTGRNQVIGNGHQLLSPLHHEVGSTAMGITPARGIVMQPPAASNMQKNYHNH